MATDTFTKVAEFFPVTEAEPPSGPTCIFYREGDLCPVIGFRMEGQWYLEEGGIPLGPHRKCPSIGEPGWEPTHYATLDGWGWDDSKRRANDGTD